MVASDTGVGLTRRSVLVVDDDRDIRETLAEILADEGYVVHTARNGSEGLELVASQRPGLVLLDLFMPIMDGAEFRRRQLGDPAIASVPVVVISAAAGLERKVASLGLAGWLEKPIHIDALFAIVGRYCG
jgi:CheY-like chemotaxis protein